MQLSGKYSWCRFFEHSYDQFLKFRVVIYVYLRFIVVQCGFIVEWVLCLLQQDLLSHELPVRDCSHTCEITNESLAFIILFYLLYSPPCGRMRMVPNYHLSL